MIENTITDYPITIAGRKINAGSWYCVIEVDNEELEQMLINRKIKGFSLFSYANGATRYSEVSDTSDVHPLFISFVEYPANQVLFEVLDKEMYISKMEAVKMADEDKSLLDKLKELLNSYDGSDVSKSEEEEEIVEEEDVVEEEEVSKAEDTEEKEEPAKEEDESEEEESTDVVAKEETEEEEEVVEEETVEEEIKDIEKDEAGMPEPEAVPEVQEEQISNADVLEAIIQLTKIIKESRTEAPAEVIEEPVADEPETYIIKQATTKVDKKIEGNEPQKKQYFDILGRKL